MRMTCFVRNLILTSTLLCAVPALHAQDSSLYSQYPERIRPPYPAPGAERMRPAFPAIDAETVRPSYPAGQEYEPELTLADASWIHSPVPPPREIQKHDIISVRVDILSRMQADGELRRRKNSLYDARLRDWIILDGLRWVKPSPQSDGEPRVRGELRSDYRTIGELQTSESLTFNIAAEVVDIRPNGNLVLEGRATARVNDEVWTVMMSGLCRPESVGPNNVVLSRDIIDLNVRKVETGSVASGYQRGWFQKVFDLIQPF